MEFGPRSCGGRVMMNSDYPPTCECGNTDDLIEINGEHICVECIMTLEYPTEPWETHDVATD